MLSVLFRWCDMIVCVLIEFSTVDVQLIFSTRSCASVHLAFIKTFRFVI